MNDEQARFRDYIVDELSAHPDWTPIAFRAVIAGAQAAHETMVQRLSKMRMGMTAAMCLVRDSRLSNDFKDMMTKAVLDAYGDVNSLSHLSEAEKDAIRQILKE